MQASEANQERTAPRGSGPAYRIHTSRLVLRCWQPQDAPLLKAAIDASLEHLRPWMVWAQYEPTDLERKIEHLRRSRGAFDLGEDFPYGIFNRAETQLPDEYPTSPAAAAEIEAFDVIGRSLPL